MSEAYQIVQRAEAAWGIIGAGIRSHNLQHGGEDGAQTLCFVLQDEAGEVIGGVIGQIFWDWLHIHLIWLPEEQRGQGWGSRLLMAIEEFAQGLGARHAYLDTYSFQAPDFYEKHGYRVFGTLADYPQGQQLFFMQKDFKLVFLIPQVVWMNTENAASHPVIDWEYVKKQTLWSYEDLIAKLGAVLAYPFVQEHYNHSMHQAQEYARKVRGGYLQHQGGMIGYIDDAAANLKALDERRLGTYSDLIRMVKTRADCETFLQQNDFEFKRLIQTLNYLLRWVLPFITGLREFVDVADQAENSLLAELKRQKITTNLDLLEAGRSKAGRERLTSSVGAHAKLVTDLVHRADISRLAYVRGKTVHHLCGGGYDTLAKIAHADLDEMEKRMDLYYRSLGKRLSDFKAVVPLSWMVGGAQTLPPIFVG